jgi:hypothetical protein
MKLRRVPNVGVAAMGECEARTQGALVAELRVRPRTKYRAVQCRLGGRDFILNRAAGTALPA